MKNIREWAKEFRHNESFAKKYEGVTTVEDILSQARKDGYSFGRQELIDFDLSSVAGGADNTNVDASLLRAQAKAQAGLINRGDTKMGVGIIKLDQNASASGNEAIAQNTGSVSITQNT
ncbi:MAG: Nif11-like leader peptide family natural product precursor [Clostridia bacterium]|nr:Nif11-like leader peptide family natural product precursor [Clostridia bacterium]